MTPTDIDALERELDNVWNYEQRSPEQMHETFLTIVRAVPALLTELRALREYEARTRDTICFGVGCVHEATALSKLADQEQELATLRLVEAKAREAAWKTPVSTMEMIALREALSQVKR